MYAFKETDNSQLILNLGTSMLEEPDISVMQTCAAVRACVIRCLLTLARTLSLCCVRAIARMGLEPAGQERLVVGRLLSSSLNRSSPETEIDGSQK